MGFRATIPGGRTALAAAIVLSILLPSGLDGVEFVPGPDGWIRHWVVYGPIVTLDSGTSPEQVHPITGEPFTLIDAIAEEEGKPDRRTERNFLPSPGREIDTAFGTLYPSQVLWRETGPGINPGGKLRGVAWTDCDCKIDFYDVFAVSRDLNFKNILIYAYAYIENITGKPLEVFISVAQIHYLHVLLGPVPDEEGAGFMKSIFVNNLSGLWGTEAGGCVETDGPRPDPAVNGVVIEDTVTLEPGLNLLLVKVVNFNLESYLSFRFRHKDSPDYTPLTGEEIRIRLSPNLDAPDPPLFRRMDSDGDGHLSVSDAVRTLSWLVQGAEPFDCADAADSDDDGKVNLTDPIATLQYLFLGGRQPPSPHVCCGIDPTEDELPDCDPSGKGC